MAQGLLQRPTDASLTLWRARILHRQEAFEQCARELRLVLARRPHHFATLRLSGLTALKLNAPLRAASFLARAEVQRPRDVPTKHALVEAWLDARRFNEARDVLSRIDHPPAQLSANYLRVTGRLLEAAETLETALAQDQGDEHEPMLCELIDILEESGNMAWLRRTLQRIDTRQPVALARAGQAWLWLGLGLLEAAETLETALAQDQGDEHEPMLCELIDILEESGNMAWLRRTLQRIDTRQPVALARAGQAWLWLGEFRTAAVRTSKLVREPGFGCSGLVVVLVAGAMLQRPKLAERALERLRCSDDPIDPKLVADTWCRGLMGRLLQSQCNPRQAGADPHTGQLGRLLGVAERTFQEQLASDTDLSNAGRIELKRRQAICLEGLQLTVETMPARGSAEKSSDSQQAALAA